MLLHFSVIIIIIIIKNECHSKIIVDRLQGWQHRSAVEFDVSCCRR